MTNQGEIAEGADTADKVICVCALRLCQIAKE